MKAILEYNLNDQDDAMAHLRAVKSLDMALALWEIVYDAKKKLEPKIEDDSINKYDALDLMFEKILEILEDHNINLGKLID